MELTQRQKDLLLLLKEEGDLYCNDDLMSPFWDQTGGDPFKPDIISECAELGLVNCEECNHDDLAFLTQAGRIAAAALSSSPDRSDDD